MVNIKVLSFFQLLVSSCPGFFEEPWVAFAKHSITSGDDDSQNGFSWRRINLKSGNPNFENFVVEMDMDGDYYNWILQSFFFVKDSMDKDVLYSNISGQQPTSAGWRGWSHLVKDKYIKFKTSVSEYVVPFGPKFPNYCVKRFMFDALFSDWFVDLFNGVERRDVEDGYVPWPSSYPDRLTFHQLCRKNGATCCIAFKVTKGSAIKDLYAKISCCKENTRLYYKNNGETEILKYFWEPHDCQSGAFSRIKIVIPELSTSATHFIGELRKQIRDAFRQTFSIGMPDEQFQNYFEVDPAEDAVRIKHGEWVKKIGVKFLNRGGNLDGHHVLRECYIDVGDVI